MADAGWEICFKPILCGGALVERQAAFEALKNGYDAEAVAVDMESYGFALWCSMARPSLPWLILRGISDHCKEESSGFINYRRKDRQFVATFRAAMLLRMKLLDVLCPSVEKL